MLDHTITSQCWSQLALSFALLSLHRCTVRSFLRQSLPLMWKFGMTLSEIIPFLCLLFDGLQLVTTCNRAASQTDCNLYEYGQKRAYELSRHYEAPRKPTTTTEADSSTTIEPIFWSVRWLWPSNSSNMNYKNETRFIF